MTANGDAPFIRDRHRTLSKRVSEPADTDRKRRSVLLVRPLINAERNSPFFLPIGLLSIAAVSRENGHQIDVLDFEFEYKVGRGLDPNAPIDAFAAEIADYAVDVVGITALADTLPTVLALGRSLKQMRPDICVVVGGPGTYGVIPSVARRFSNCLDYLCTGEGELSFLDLLNSDLRCDVPGMVMSGGHGSSASTGSESDVGELPFPAYDLVDVPAYLKIASPRIFDLHVGAGCTYKCSFCTTAPFWRHKFNVRSPEAILGEMEYIYRSYGVTAFNFIHDNFANDREYLDDFVTYFAERNTIFTWGCATRPDNVPLDLMRRMRIAGCRFIFCGTDSGSASVLRHMRKLTSNEKSYRFFRDARAADLSFETNTIVGYPNEGDDDLESSLKIVLDAVAFGAKTADVSVLQPLPGAPVTLAHRDMIEPVDDNGVPTYLPREARELITANRDIFTGFGFIHCGNRRFEYYCRVADILRYFTRHFFRTIYFLKEQANIPYRVVIDDIMNEESPHLYGHRLGAFVRHLNLDPSRQDLLNSVLRFDAALDTVRGIDVAEELKNIYSRPEAAGTAVSIVVNLNHEVHKMFAKLPEITSVGPLSVSYLLRRDHHGITTIRLKDWQRRLWTNIRMLPRPIEQSAESARWALDLSTKAGVGIEQANIALNKTLALFNEVNLPELG